MRTPARGPRAATLQVVALEDRLAPALNILFDYSLDANGFFNDPSHRAALERAAAQYETRLDTPLAAVTAGGNNTWQAVFFNPATGAEVRLDNPATPAQTLTVYAGARNIGGNEAGVGGPGGYWASGTRAFQQTVATRGVTGFSTWGGSLAFDTGTNWYFGTDPTGRTFNQVDFESVATHELAHVLGFGTATQFAALSATGAFVGSHAEALGGGSVPLDGAHEHFAQGTRSNGHAVAMQPMLDPNGRVSFSELDIAALLDIGWQSAGAAPPAPVALPANPTPAPVAAAPSPVPLSPPVLTESATGGSSAQLAGTDSTPVVVSGANGTVQIYKADAYGSLTLAASPFAPFPGFQGAVRSAVGDVTGDGLPDIILGTGPGGGSRVRVLDGATYADVVQQFSAFENGFTGGIYLAAADFDGDGRAEVVVTPDQGGGPRVRVLSVANGQANPVADFFGINDPNFRGGARVAAADVNGDGTPDLIVAAGFGGGPRVSLIDGRSVQSGVPRTLTPDFFAFEPGLRNGVYVATGDVNGDGAADLIFGAGPGGGPRVLSVSGQTLIQSGPATALAQPLANAFVGDPGDRGGVRVAVKDGRVVAGSGTTASVQVLDGRSLTPKTALIPFTSTDDGVYVG
jgi:hypothetical protein